RTIHHNTPRVEQQCSVRHLADHREIVANQQYRPTLARGNVLHLAQTLLLKLIVADSEHFINDEHVTFEVRGDREGETHIHAGAVSLHRHIEEAFHPSKRDYLVEFALNVRPAHPENGAIKENILATTQFGMKASTHLQQARYPAAQDS